LAVEEQEPAVGDLLGGERVGLDLLAGSNWHGREEQQHETQQGAHETVLLQRSIQSATTPEAASCHDDRSAKRKNAENRPGQQDGKLCQRMDGKLCQRMDHNLTGRSDRISSRL